MPLVVEPPNTALLDSLKQYESEYESSTVNLLEATNHGNSSQIIDLDVTRLLDDS